MNRTCANGTVRHLDVCADAVERPAVQIDPVIALTGIVPAIAAELPIPTRPYSGRSAVRIPEASSETSAVVDTSRRFIGAA
jgi:hypothetical protein